MQRIRSPRLALLLPLALLAGSAWNARAAQPYAPQRSFEFEESWRWRTIEQLDPYILCSGSEGADGSLYFASKTGLVIYDGYRSEEHPYPLPFKDSIPLQVFASRNGSAYLLTTTGLLSFKDGAWQTVSEHPDTLEIRSKIRMARNAHGLELIALPGGLHRIEGERLVLIPEIAEEIEEIAFDRQNLLWLVESYPEGERVMSYRFDGDQLQTPIAREAFDFPSNPHTAQRLIASPESDEVWIVNWRQNQSARTFDRASRTWRPVDFASISGNNRHINGALDGNGNLLLFTKTELLIKRDDAWHILKYPNYDVPSNEPFVIQRSNGNLVLGGQGERARTIDTSSDHYESYRGIHFQCDAPNGSRWFISKDGGIIQHDPATDTWSVHAENVIDAPLSLLADRDGSIWASGSHGKTAAVSRYDGAAWTRNLHPELGSFVGHLSAIELSNGELAFGSGDEELELYTGGTIHYTKEDGRYRHQHHPPPATTQRPSSLAQLDPQTLWMAGLNLNATALPLDQPQTEIGPFHDGIWIDHIAANGNGTAWVGIWEKGLYRYQNGEWSQIPSPDSIASRQVVYILNDRLRTDSTWVATSRGVSRFDGQRWYPLALPEELRLHRESGTLKQAKDGSLWVNEASRNWYFRSGNASERAIGIDDRFKSIRYTPNADPPVVSILSYDERTTSPANVRIEWSGIDRWSATPAHQLRYSYRYDQGPWSPFESQTNTLLLDLPSGDHAFEVRALDRDGNISPAPAAIQFSVIPPLWKQPWFIAAASLVALALIALVYLLYRQRIRYIIRMDEFKLQFFTNISHELRTPLTVIIGPLESMLAKSPESWTAKPLEIAHKNAKKTLHLIDQLLDFRSVDTGNLFLNLTHADIIQCAKESIELIRPLATEQSQTLEFKCAQSECLAWFDPEKLERIINNLVSNASKYTDQNGDISVTLKLDESGESVNATLIVEDNGTGIPPSKIDHIFEPFYRAGNTANSHLGGSGIGLAYTKKLVEAFSGTIAVESPVAHPAGATPGTRFTLTLPLKKYILDSEVSETGDASTDSEIAQQEEKPCILLVEDDPDIRDFIEHELKNNYNVLKARDGEAGLKIAKQKIPDIILTDVMMPRMNGRQLCHHVKNDPITCHIPVIMLTALKSDLHELEGLSDGADDYLTKPISIPILERRIHNCLEARRKLHEHFKSHAQNADAPPPALATNPMDEKFLAQAFELVERRLDDAQFDVSEMARKMGMSRMTLYRKFKAITGDTPSIFIRSRRMALAAQLLSSGACNVTEVTYRVGFSDQSAFSTSFKSHYKQSPSQFVAKPAPAAPNPQLIQPRSRTSRAPTESR